MSAAIKFTRRYTVCSGATFLVFERASDGARVDVKIRAKRGDVERYTRREARIVAEDRLAGSPAIWSVVCDDYSTDPATLAVAERLAAEIVELAASSSLIGCRLPHKISDGTREIAV